jgi:hypothetical protein
MDSRKGGKGEREGRGMEEPLLNVPWFGREKVVWLGLGLVEIR